VRSGVVFHSCVSVVRVHGINWERENTHGEEVFARSGVSRMGSVMRCCLYWGLSARWV
jgi:hypothetical protein